VVRFHSVLGFVGNGGGRLGGVGRWWCDGRIHLPLLPHLCRWPGGRQQRRRGLGEFSFFFKHNLILFNLMWQLKTLVSCHV
jgi:hypothetical protein